MSAPAQSFRFGENWLAFAHGLTDAHVAEAQASLRALLGLDRLDGRRFLDIGSGSGLFSLAARRLGAAVHSFDRDPDSVACTSALRSRYCPGDEQWSIERGSILDDAFVDGLGTFDIVYSWGVLHHTGAMRAAIRKAAWRVGPGGLFAFALYRRTRLCRAWQMEKRWYSGASPRSQRLAMVTYVGLMRASFRLRRRDFARYVSTYRSNRGMDFYHDVHDWLGGYPYESIQPSEVADLMRELGFTPVRSTTGRYSIGLFGSGCDEYVYRAPAPIQMLGH